MQYKAEGVVTKTWPLGEADRIVSIYTRERGKISAVAKGSRRPKSKLGGRIELFCQDRFLLNKGKSLDLIVQAEIVNNYYPIRNDYDKIMLASYVANTINMLTFPEHQSLQMYDLILRVLDLLTSSDDYVTIKRLFQNRFLEIEGLSAGHRIASDEEFDKIIIDNFT